MIRAVIAKELRTFSRSGVFLALSCAIFTLIIAASLLSAQRLATFERERDMAEHIDEQVWESQGARNPHAAAHFSRYAFKPIPNLAAFDPGITDYAGLAVWMEAHVQNPAVFRRAEDHGQAGQFANLSPAWVLQVLAPLFLFLVLFGAISGEREDGTLKQTLAAGAGTRTLLLGKLVSACIAIGVVAIPAVLIGLWTSASANNDAALSDTWVRAFGLVILYALYFIGLGGLALGISALCRDRRSALLTLVALWAVSVVLLPRVGGAVAATLFPQPEPTQLLAELESVSAAFQKDTAYREKIDADILAQYGVDTIDALPVSYVGYRLQKSEEHSNPLFDAFYGRVNALHSQQQSVLDALSVLSPVLAIQTLSSGLAGTDRFHQIDFTQAAEMHRRKIIKQLNNDLFLNGAKEDGPYLSDPTLWEAVANLDYAAPPISGFARRYLPSALILLFYAVFGVVCAVTVMKRAQSRVAA